SLGCTLPSSVNRPLQGKSASSCSGPRLRFGSCQGLLGCSTRPHPLCDKVNGAFVSCIGSASYVGLRPQTITSFVFGSIGRFRSTSCCGGQRRPTCYPGCLCTSPSPIW